MVSRAGHSADLSAPVMTRALCHFDNAYWLPEVAMHGYSRKTNTQSNTAFRGFGGPQGAIAIENILDSVARELGRDPLDVRRANFYGNDERNVTPYVQTRRRQHRPRSWSPSWRRAATTARGATRSPPSTPRARCSSAASR